MTRKRKRRSDKVLRSASEHLLHEIGMLNDTTQILMAFGSPKDKQNWVTKNALLESFAIHARNLIDFFYQKAQV